MPSKCCMPSCNGNYETGPKVHVFRFPKDEELKKKWIHAVHRKEFKPSKYSRVCHLHFKPEDIEWTSSMVDPRTGVVISAPLLVPRLVVGAIPKILPNCASYFSSSDGPSRENPEVKKMKRESDSIQHAVKQSLEELKKHDILYSIASINELKSKTHLITLKDHWNIIINNNNVIIIFIDISQEVHNIVHIFINELLDCKVYVRGVAINIKDIAGTVSNIHQLDHIIENVNDHFTVSGTTSKNSLLLSVINELDVPEKSSNVLNFVKKQVQMSSYTKNCVRYDSETVIFSSLLYFISPHAYNFLRSSGNVILPHVNTIRNVCADFNVNPVLEQQSHLFLNYIKQKVYSLQPYERSVILMIDEIHIQPFIDYKCGNLVGMAYDGTYTATTAHIFMIQSILSPYKDVVHILPVHTIKADALHVIIRNIIIGLHKLDLKVISIVTDNNSVNGKAVSLLSDPPCISVTYKNPFDATQPIFYLIDSVHIFKCIRNNWLKQKTDGISFIYPDFDNPAVVNTVSFSALRMLFNIEKDKLVKFGFGLSVKSLWPSTLEKQNVKLVSAIFNEHVINAVLTLGPKLKNRFYFYSMYPPPPPHEQESWLCACVHCFQQIAR